MTRSVIQFIGTQRSGSNLLRLMLNQHSVISAPHPPHLLKTFMPLISKYGDLKVRENRYLLVDDVCNWVEYNSVEWSLIKFDRDKITDEITSLLDLFEIIYQQKCAVDKAEIRCFKSTFNIEYKVELKKCFVRLDHSLKPQKVVKQVDGGQKMHKSTHTHIPRHLK